MKKLIFLLLLISCKQEPITPIGKIGTPLSKSRNFTLDENKIFYEFCGRLYYWHDIDKLPASAQRDYPFLEQTCLEFNPDIEHSNTLNKFGIAIQFDVSYKPNDIDSTIILNVLKARMTRGPYVIYKESIIKLGLTHREWVENE